MKQITILLLFSFIFGTKTFSQNNENLIQDVVVQTDFVENGVKGILISINCDYNILRKKYETDSLLNHALRQARFSYNLTLFQDSIPIKSAFGYQSAFEKNEILELKFKCDPTWFDSKPIISENKVFIPYAAIKLKEGKQQKISVSIDLYGKDGFNNTYKQNTRSTLFSFDKPFTKIFECALDSLVVKPFNKEGQAWDHELFGTDAPDLDFSIKMGDLEVGNIHKGNAYFITFRDKPRVFRFLISENDEITIYLVDTDNAFHDPIASWRFNTSNMKENIVYQQKEAKSNLESFSFKCKIRKVIN